VRSAIFSWRGQLDSKLLTLIKNTVTDLLSTQTADGCISSYPLELQTKDWDIWGRKYVLLGLARYYLEIEPDEAVKTAMTRELDYLISQVGPRANNILECGQYNGMAASSVLEPAVLTYRVTGEKRFLDYALWIAGQGGSTINNIFTTILQGVPVRELGDFIEDVKTISPERAAALKLLRVYVKDIVKDLPEREKKILNMRFGLEDGVSHTLEEVGKVFGVTRERIRQIEAKALERIKELDEVKKIEEYF